MWDLKNELNKKCIVFAYVNVGEKHGVCIWFVNAGWIYNGRRPK